MKDFKLTPSIAILLVLIILVSLATLRYDGFLGTYNVHVIYLQRPTTAIGGLHRQIR